MNHLDGFVDPNGIPRGFARFLDIVLIPQLETKKGTNRMIDLLPRFTYLIGPEDSIESRCDLAKAMLLNDPAGEMKSFEYPIHLALDHILTGEIDPNSDYLSTAGRNSELLYGHSTTGADLIHAFTDILRGKFGESILGTLTLQSMLRNDAFELGVERHIFVDTNSFYDILPFTEKFGPSQHLLIRLGPIGALPPPRIAETLINCRHIWLPVESTEERIKLLLKELRDAHRR